MSDKPVNRKKYDREFKLQSIEYWKKSDKTADEAEKDLGLSQGSLSRWKREFTQNGEVAFGGNGKLKSRDEVLREYEKQIADLKMERDILKKTVGIFSKPQK